MGYIQNSLITGEKIVHEAKVSYWSQLSLIVAGIILLPMFFVGALLFLIAFLNVISTELAFTNKRLIAKYGFITRRTVEIQITKIESLQVDQGILGRMFNFGTIVISGAGNPQAPIRGVKDPLSFKRAFVGFIDKPAETD